jgi:hypothetical protein
MRVATIGFPGYLRQEVTLIPYEEWMLEDLNLIRLDLKLMKIVHIELPDKG